MEPAGAAESVALIIRLLPDAHGGYKLQVERAGDSQEYSVTPFTVSVQLWQPADAPLLRAILRLHGTRHTTVIQSNRQLIALLRAWLNVEDPATDD